MDFSRIEKIMGRIFLGILACAIALFVCEFVYRYVRNHNRVEWNLINDAAESFHVPKPYVMFTAQPDLDGSEGKRNINKLGYLGPLPEIKKAAEEFRIFVLGGSTVFMGDPPFVTSLEQEFHEHGLPNIKVFNFGIVSSVSRQELIRILIDIAGYRPDLIVSYSGYNDTYDFGWDPRINYPHRFILYEADPALSIGGRGYKLLPILALASQFLKDFFPKQLFNALTAGILPATFPGRWNLRDKIAKAYIQNLRWSNRISKDLGADFVAIYQPTLYFKSPVVGGEVRLNDPKSMRDARIIRAAVLHESGKLNGEFPFYDWSDLFQGTSREVFVDSVHYKDQRAQQFIARKLFDLLDPIVRRDIRKVADKAAPSKMEGLVPEEEFVF